MTQQGDQPPNSRTAFGKRKFIDYFFSYSWADLSLVSTLRNAWVALYMLLAVVGYVADPLGHPGSSAFCMAALANYPAYWLGLRLQAHIDAAALRTNELMVWQLGNLAKLFSCVGAIYAVKWFVNV